VFKKNLISYWQAILLGAIYGFMFGGVAEIAREMRIEYEERQLMRLSTEQGMPNICLVDTLRWNAIPCLFMFTFAVVSFLVHRFWINRPPSLTRLWQIIGLMAVALFLVPTMAWDWWQGRIFTSEFQQTAIFLLLAALLLGPLYGVSLQLVAKYRRHFNQPKLP
jgi:hypothetical protein